MQIPATIHQAICRGLADCHFLVVVDITIFVYLYIVGVLALVDRGGDAYTAYTRYIQLADYDSCTLCFACIRCMNLCTICIPNTYVYTRDIEAVRPSTSASGLVQHASCPLSPLPSNTQVPASRVQLLSSCSQQHTLVLHIRGGGKQMSMTDHDSVGHLAKTLNR